MKSLAPVTIIVQTRADVKLIEPLISLYPEARLLIAPDIYELYDLKLATGLVFILLTKGGTSDIPISYIHASTVWYLISEECSKKAKVMRTFCGIGVRYMNRQTTKVLARYIGTNIRLLFGEPVDTVDYVLTNKGARPYSKKEQSTVEERSSR